MSEISCNDLERLLKAERERSLELVKALKACQQDTLFYAEEVCEDGSLGRREAWVRMRRANRVIDEFEASRESETRCQEK